MCDETTARDTNHRLAAREAGDVSDALPLRDLVADSFALVELVIALQDELGVRLSHEDLAHVDTVGDLVAVLVRAHADANRCASAHES